MLKSFLFIIIFSILCSSCAYHWGFPRQILLGGYDKIAIPIFKNKTKEAGAEVYFTNALIRNFERSRIASVQSVSGAPVTLLGEIISIKYKPIVSVEGGRELKKLPLKTVLTTSYAVYVLTRLSLQRNSDKKVIWSSSFNGESVYSSPQMESAVVNSLNALYNQSARYKELQKLSKIMMIEVHDRLTENF